MSKTTADSKVPSSRTTVEQVDVDTLAQAQEMLGAPTPEDTVNEALREVVRRRLVADFVEFMATADLEDPDTVKGAAWR